MGSGRVEHLGGLSLREAAGHDREAWQQGKAAVVADAREGRSRPSQGGVWGIVPGGRPRPATARTYNSCLLSEQKQRTYPLLLPPKPQFILLLLAGSSP